MEDEADDDVRPPFPVGTSPGTREREWGIAEAERIANEYRKVTRSPVGREALKERSEYWMVPVRVRRTNESL